MSKVTLIISMGIGFVWALCFGLTGFIYGAKAWLLYLFVSFLTFLIVGFLGSLYEEDKGKR